MNKLTEVVTKAGFNPNGKNGFGSGIACGLLFVFDLPLTVIASMLMLFKVDIRSLGLYAFKDMRKKETTFGSIVGFILCSVGIGAWFNPDYQFIMVMVSIVLGIIGVIATFTSKSVTF